MGAHQNILRAHGCFVESQNLTGSLGQCRLTSSFYK